VSTVDLLSQASAEAFAVCKRNETHLDTLEFRHPLFLEGETPAPGRVVCNKEDFYGTLEADAPLNGGESVRFVRGAFGIELPRQDDTGSGTLVMKVDNVLADLARMIDQVSLTFDPIEVTFRGFIAEQPSAPSTLPIHMELTDITVDVNEITAVASFSQVYKRAYPMQLFTKDRFPGL